MRIRHGWFLALAAASTLTVGATGGAGHRDDGDKPASGDPESCAACHQDEVTALTRSPHSVLDSKKLARRAGADSSCAACHGDAAVHLDAGGSLGTIFGFGDDRSAGARAERCLACHATDHPGFRASRHAAAGVDCTSCHSVHHAASGSSSLLRSPAPAPVGRRELGASSAVCHSCHEDVFTRFDFNEHHRLQEGILTCVSCHDPHAAGDRGRLGGFDQEACIRCHADKGGPFVYEHAASRVEGCLACHSPHGSPNRHLLAFQGTAELCFSCHGAVPGFHSGFTFATVCTNCHVSIHGSNFDGLFLK
jgi:DmsE family decaheme c-type cytochrome